MSYSSTLTTPINPVPSEYRRDLIRRDMPAKEQQAFDRLKAELTHAYAAPEASYQPLTAAEVIARNKQRGA